LIVPDGRVFQLSPDSNAMTDWKSPELKAREAETLAGSMVAGIIGRANQPPSPFPKLDSQRRRDVAKRAAYLALKVQGASLEQMQFFETYLLYVFDEAVHVTPKDGIMLQVSTDFYNVTFGIKASRELMLRLANRFLEACKVPDLRLYGRFVQVHQETQGAEAWLFCYIKRISGTHPALDFGYTLETQCDWLLLELLLPRSADQETLRNIAMGERRAPTSYGCSLMPVEPESSLSFNVVDQSFKSSVLTSLFIFKAMGLTKPEDMLLKALTSVKGKKVSLHAHLGPKGLTKLASRIWEPLGDSFVEEVATAARTELNAESLSALNAELGVAGPAWIDFLAESRGYSVSVGYLM